MTLHCYTPDSFLIFRTHIEELQGLEKVVSLTSSEMANSEDVTKLLEQLRDLVPSTSSSGYQLADILTLVVMIYSLNTNISPGDEETLLHNAILKSWLIQYDNITSVLDDYAVHMHSMNSVAQKQERFSVEDRAERFFKMLTQITRIRDVCTNIGPLCRPMTEPVQHVSLVKQISDAIDSPVSPLWKDFKVVSHQPFGQILSNVGRLLASQQTLPSQFDTVIVCVIGGITHEEIRDLKSISTVGKKVHILSTNLVSRPEILKVLCNSI